MAEGRNATPGLRLPKSISGFTPHSVQIKENQGKKSQERFPIPPGLPQIGREAGKENQGINGGETDRIPLPAGHGQVAAKVLVMSESLLQPRDLQDEENGEDSPVLGVGGMGGG